MAGKTTEGPGLKLDEFLCFGIYAAGHAFNRVYKQLLDELNMTYPQYLVMVLLWERNDQTVGELGARLFLESNTLTPLLKRLESLGYIARRRDPSDERQVRISLTDMGAALRAKAAAVPTCIQAASGLDAAQARQLLNGVTALREALDSYRPD